MVMAEQQWQPTLNEQQTRQVISAYNQNPQSYAPHLEKIRNHANYHNVPFYEGEFSILEAIKQAGAGLIEGFTTFNLLEHPDNQWESIIRNVSHLVGFAPGIIASPLTKLGFKAAALIPKRGIPLAIAEDVLLPKASKLAKKVLGTSLIKKTAAGASVAKFLSTPMAKDIATGAFNLGTASAISSWQHGVDSMLDSFFHGAIAGGVFKVIGNKIKMGDKTAQTFARGLSGSLFMGLPDTIRGATVPDQVYSYLMGAYFGGKELSWQRSQAKKITAQNIATARGSKDHYLEQTLDPTRFETWKDAPEEVKPLLYEEAFKHTKFDILGGEKPGNIGYEVMEKVGLEKEIIKAQEEIGKKPKEVEVEPEIKPKEVVSEEYEVVSPKYIFTKRKRFYKDWETHTLSKYEKEHGKDNIEVHGKELIGKDYVEGSTVIIDAIIPMETLPKGKKVVHRVVEPGIRHKKTGKTLQAPKIILASGTRKPTYKESVESYKKELKSWESEQSIRKKMGKEPLPDSTKPKPPKKIVSKPVKQKFILTSGKRGLESTISEEAEKLGLKPIQVKLIDQLPVGKFGKGEIVELLPNTLDKADTAVRTAIDEVNKRVGKVGYGNIIDISKFKGGTGGTAMMNYKRDAVKVKYSDSVVMLGELEGNLSELKRLNRLPGQIAINSGKPFYVFDKKLNSWFKYNPELGNPMTKELGMFQILDTIPEIGDRTAFFGPEAHDPIEIQAMQDILKKGAYVPEKGQLPFGDKKKEESNLIELEDVAHGEGFEIAPDNSLGGIINSELARDKTFIKKHPTIEDRTTTIKKVLDSAIETYKPYTDIEAEGNKPFENSSNHWVDSYKWIKEVETKTGLKLPEQLKGNLRKWLVRQKHGKLISLGVTDGSYENTEIANQNTPYTRNRTLKNQVAPKSIIEEILDKYETADIKKPVTEKGPRYTQSEAGVRHVPELAGKDLTKTTTEVRDTIENTEGVTLRTGHKAVWFGPEDYIYTGAKHKAKEMPDNIRELKNEVEDALNLPRDYYDSVLMNKLPKGTKISAHRDAEGIFKQKDGTIGSVGVLSLGGKSVIDIQKPYGKSVEKHTIKSGDVYELPAGQFQATKIDHFHQVGPSKTDRLSLTFRRTKYAPELTEPISQPIPSVKTTPYVKTGPANIYIDAIDYNGQDIPMRRFVSRVANLLSGELDKHGNPKYQTYEKSYEAAEKLLTEYTKNTVKAMNDKYDMHLWGGEGDKDKLVFVKHHPEANKVIIPKGAIPKDLFDFAKERYGLTKEQELRAMKSLIKYHEDINGVPVEETIGKDGWIENTVKLNKRLPVIMNTGWRGDKAFINNPRMVGNLRLSNKGNYKGIIVRDAKKLADILGVKNEDLLQITDGSIITESATLNGIQKDRGSNYQGQEKSVLVWNGLLGKYMQHKTLPEGNQMMRDFKNIDPELGDGINFIIYDSSAKQRADYPVGNYEIKNGKLELTEGAEVFEIDPGAFRYNYGVYDGPSDLGYKNGVYRGIALPKQTFVMPHGDMFVKTDPKIQEDFFNELAGRAFEGTKEANDVLLDYQVEISKNKVAIPGTEAEIVREHFHEMGVREIQDILTKPGNEKLAQEMLLEMLNISHESQERLALEGEGFGKYITDSINNIADFKSSAENIIKHASALDMPAFPLFFGKYTKRFVERTINKWLVDKVFKPKIKNSIKGRMRPFDKWLREKFPEANDDNLAMKKFGVPSDELVFAGDLFKPTPFYDPVTRKWTTLGKGWDVYQKETNKTKRKLYEDTFDALVIRVPQDSASGAQVLRFAGFTGIDDHGTMLHGRAMEKLGGADLDADSDFMFFGGRHADGTGEGFKNEWKQMYRAQKDEFIALGEVRPRDIASPGTGLTLKYAIDNSKHRIVNPTANELIEWVRKYGIKKVNIAGSRPSKLKGELTPKKIKAILMEGLKEVDEVNSGGQLGVDMLGLEAGKELKKKTGGVAPPGFQQKRGISAKALLESFGLTEGEADPRIYPKRTLKNVQNTDGTVLFAPLKIKKPSKTQQLVNVKDRHHRDIVLTQENLEAQNINPNIYDYAKNTNGKYPYLQYSPSLRTYIGEQTAASRELMPPVVSLVQNSRAAWSSILRSPSKEDIIEWGTIKKGLNLKKLKEPILYKIIRRPKDELGDKYDQITLSSALIRFTADPANEIGLIPFKNMQTLLDGAYYHPRELYIFNAKEGKGWELSGMKSLDWYIPLTFEVKQILTPDVKKESRYNLMRDFNKAFFSWDYNENKHWTYEQKQALIKDIDTLTEQERSTALPKFAHLMKDIDYRISIYDRVNSKAYNEMHNEHTRIYRGLPDKNFFKKLLKRTRLDKPKSKQVQFVFDTQLNNKYYRELLAGKDPAKIIEMFDNAKYGYKTGIKRKDHGIEKTDTKEEIIDKLNIFLNNSEHYLENAIWEMTTIDLVVNEYKKAINNGKKISDAEMKSIIDAVEQLKEVNAARVRQRQIARDFTPLEEESSASNTNDKYAKEILRVSEKPDLKESKKDAILDQAEIDNMIRGFKDRLSSQYSKNVFDYFLLGSLKGKTEKKVIDDYMKLERYHPVKQPVLRSLHRQGAKTGTSQLAFNSEAVSSTSIKNFLKGQNKKYDTSVKPTNKIPPKVKEHIKKFEESEIIKKLDPIEELKTINLENTIVSDIVGFENLKKGKLSAEHKKVILELADLIKTDPNFNPAKFNRTIMGLYAYIDPTDPVVKSLDQMNLSDFQRIINTYKQIKGGTVHQRLEKNLPLLKQLSLKARHHMQFPLMVSTEQMAKDIIHIQKKGYMKDWLGKEPKEIDILYPTSWGEILQTQIGRFDGLQEAHSSRLNNEFLGKIRFLSQATGLEGLALHNLATAKIQLKQDFESSEMRKIYQDHWYKLSKLYNWSKLKTTNFNLDIDGTGRKQYTGEQVLKITENIIETEYNKNQELNTGKFEKISKEDYENLSKVEKNLWKKDSETGEYTKHPLEEYTLGFYDNKKTQRILNIKKFIKDLKKAFYKGPDESLDFALNVGSDGIRQLMRSMAIELMPIEQYVKERVNRKTGEIKREIISVEDYYKLSTLKKKEWKPDKELNIQKLEKLEMFSTGTRKGYIPHYFNDTSASKETMTKELKEISDKYNRLKGNSDSSKEKQIFDNYVQEYKSTLMKYKFQNGDYDLGSKQDLQTAFDLLMFKEAKEQLIESEVDRLRIGNLPSITKRAGHTRARENHKTDWIVDPAIHGIYIENATKDLYGSLTNLITRWTLNEMNKHNYKKIVTPYIKKDGSPKQGKEKDYKESLQVVKGFNYFWQQYVREAQGMPTIVSPEAWNDPSLHISTTPYGWFADNIWANRLNKIGESLGLLDTKGELPKELQGMDNYDMQTISSIEARYQLATLMTHPKTPINNVFGGTMHTFQSVGYEPMRKAYDYNYLQTLNPKWKNAKAVYKDLDEMGVSVDLARHELGLDKALSRLGNQEFIDAVSSKAVGDTEVTKEEMKALGKKYGVTKPIVDIAAKFMSIPEKRLRRDAWLAHYIKAWERFGGAISNPYSPILIEIAKKGVKATQFLYSAPYRPAFARSGVGKIMSRFQLWAWNAVRFRNDVRKMAQRYGYKPGTEGMIKFERMMTTDLFVMALGSMFMYSMFEQVIPAPYNWLQDTAQWVFGDEKERDRAFFGQYPGALAPLQLISPPIARIPVSIIREFAEDDYTKLADYYMWTFLPFGRIARDLLHPKQNIFANPMRIPEKFFGIPLTGFSQHAKRMREETYEPLYPGKSLEMF